MKITIRYLGIWVILFSLIFGAYSSLALKADPPEGFKLSELTEGSLYRKWGLQNGDIITSIDDKKITSAKSAIEALNSIRGKSEIVIVVLRDGVQKVVKVEQQKS